MRETSKHLVNVIDVSKLRDRAIEYLNERCLLSKGETLNTTLKFAIIAKNGKHWFINSQGVGNEKPLEEEHGIIDWYKETQYTSGMYPAVTQSFDFDGLMEMTTVTETITLDKFIRPNGNSPERNFRIWNQFLSRN
jgi:hypothetical protein